NDNIGYYYGGNKLKKTIDGGKSFSEIGSNLNTPIKQLYFINEAIGFGIDSWQEDLLSTSDGGVTWTYVESTRYSPIVKIEFFDQNTGYAIGRSNVIFKTTDRGVSWQRLDLGSGGMSAAYFINKEIGLFVDGAGKLKRTINGGTD